MPQQLYLLRHAKAEPWSPLGNDFSRALSERGINDARLLAGWARDTLTVPDTVLCSPAKRSRQTLAPLLGHWPQLLSATDYIDSIYGASLKLLLTLVDDAFSYSERLLMVGHNPGLEEVLTGVLRKKQDSPSNRMATGTLVTIEFSDRFCRANPDGILKHQVRGKTLSV